MIFLDNNSTTPLDDEVKDHMMDSLAKNFGNPHSNFHRFGLDAKKKSEESRSKIAYYFNTDPSNVIFTSGATESNNLMIQGAALKAQNNKVNKNKILCSAIEHKCVLNAVEFCKRLGFETEIIPVTKEGLINTNWLAENIDENTLLVSVMTINNETGLRTNVEEISEICSKFDVIFHSDIAQALHGEKFDLGKRSFDAVSVSAHKIYGPKGIGCLVFSENPTKFIEPILHGGLQEQEVRSGTLPVFLTTGIGSAFEILDRNFINYREHSRKLRNKFLSEIRNFTQDIYPNFNNDIGHPGTVNLYLKDVDADMICMRLGDKVAVSSTAACNGLDFEYSYVLKNMGFSKDIAKSSIRLCFGRHNNLQEAIDAAKLIYEEYKFIRENL